MVKLIVNDLAQITFLENALLTAKIDYELWIDKSKTAIPKPYLEVDGVPLDWSASMTWIADHQN